MTSRIEQDNEQYPPTRPPSPAAQRMRRYRKQRRQGLRSVRIPPGVLRKIARNGLVRPLPVVMTRGDEPGAIFERPPSETYETSSPRETASDLAIFISDKVTLHVSREKDGKWRLVYAGWHDAKVVQPDGCGQARRGVEGRNLPPPTKR
jgi:hypothetical protein